MCRSCALQLRAARCGRAARARSACRRASARTPDRARGTGSSASRASAVERLHGDQVLGAALRCTATSSRASSTCSSRTSSSTSAARSSSYASGPRLPTMTSCTPRPAGQVLGRVWPPGTSEPRAAVGSALVDVGDRVDHDRRAARRGRRARATRSASARVEPGLAPRRAWPASAGRGPGRRPSLRRAPGPARPRACVQVGLGRLEPGGRLADLSLDSSRSWSACLICFSTFFCRSLEVVGVGERDGHRADRQRASRGSGCPGDGERYGGRDAPGKPSMFGEVNASTVTARNQTLMYLRVSRSVGISVSTGPRIAMTSTAQA